MVPIEQFIVQLEDNHEYHYQFGERVIPSEDHEIMYKKLKL